MQNNSVNKMSYLFSSFISLKQQSGDLSQNFAENQQTAVKLMNFKTEELVTIYQSALSKEKLESAKHSNQLQQINWTGQEDKMKTNSLSFSDCKSINWPLAQHPTPPLPAEDDALKLKQSNMCSSKTIILNDFHLLPWSNFPSHF